MVTAHHADDQVETILMRLIRGSRLRHLTGIKESQVVDEIEIIRPLLPFHKGFSTNFFISKIKQIRKIPIFAIAFGIGIYQNLKRKSSS